MAAKIIKGELGKLLFYIKIDEGLCMNYELFSMYLYMIEYCKLQHTQGNKRIIKIIYNTTNVTLDENRKGQFMGEERFAYKKFLEILYLSDFYSSNFDAITE